MESLNAISTIYTHFCVAWSVSLFVVCHIRASCLNDLGIYSSFGRHTLVGSRDTLCEIGLWPVKKKRFVV